MLTCDQGQQLLEAANAEWLGAHPSRAGAFIVALHGRGADAASIFALTDVLAQPGICFIAPEAPGRSWYPHPFIAPIAANEPWLGASLARVGSILDAIEGAGVPSAKIGLCGFSQGACLALETALRRPRPYGAIIGLSGGYIGPMGAARSPHGRLEGARVFLGCSDVDPHIPVERVRETTSVFRMMGADVDERIYSGFGHSVNDDEVEAARRLLSLMIKPQE
jgi:phospholipase/carboxylesterase